MNKKKAFKVISASTIAASAFVATVPFSANAASNNDVQSLVKKAKDAGTVLKWAISTEGSADGKTRPYPQYNAAKAARDNAIAAINKLPTSQRAAYLADIEQNVNIHITRTMHYIDAITAGEKINEKKAALDSQIAVNKIDDNTEAAYHALSSEIRKQAILLDRVYGQSTRDAIRAQYKKTAEAVRDSVKYAVTVKMELDSAKQALAANNQEDFEKHLAEAAKYMNDVQNATMKTDLQKVYGELEAQLTAKVVSVTPINATQVVVAFNKEINAKDATAGKFVLEGKNPSTVSVAEDNKTVTLTFGEAINGTKLVFTVEPIQTKADAKVTTTRYVSSITYKDTTAPTVANVAYEYGKDTATAVVNFSEPLKTPGTVSVDGAVRDNVTFKDGNKVEIPGLEVGKSYKIDIVGATDQANNVANPISQNITVPAQVKDEVKPVGSIVVSGNKVTLHFSEELSTLGTVTINGTNVTSHFVKDANDKTKYELDAQEAGILNGVNFLNATIAVDGYKDIAKNAGEKVEAKTTLTADTTAPAFVSAATNKDNTKLLVAFNDEVKAGDLTANGELVLKVKDNVHQTSSKVDLTAENTAFGYDLDGNKKIEGTEKNIVAINYNFTEKSSYTFELAGKAIADVYGNKVADTLTFNVTAPEIAKTPVQPQAVVNINRVTVSGSVLTVTFNKEMSDTALVAANYTLGGKVLPTDTDIKFVNNKSTVEITLPEGFIAANGTYVLEATSLLDKDSNTLVDGKVAKSLVLTENVAPRANSISIVDSKHFTVDFSEAVKDTNSVSGVTVKVNGQAVTATAAASNGKVTFTTAKDFNTTDAISVEFKSANLYDANNNQVKDGVVAK